MNPARVADELAIRILVDRYADAIVRRDEEAWSATWADDGRWHVLGDVAIGREAVVLKWQDLMGRLPFVHQIASGGLLTFSEGDANGHVEFDSARGRFYVNEYATTATAGAPGLLTLGVYHDDYIRTEQGWRFQCRRFSPLYMGPPDMSGRAMPYPTDDQQNQNAE